MALAMTWTPCFSITSAPNPTSYASHRCRKLTHFLPLAQTRFRLVRDLCAASPCEIVAGHTRSRLETVGFLHRPYGGWRLSRIRLGEDGVYSAAGGLVCRLHAGEIGVGAHVVGSEQQVRNLGVCVRTVLQRVCRVDQQWLQVSGCGR